MQKRKLDNLETIKKWDKNHMVSLLLDFPNQCKKAKELIYNLKNNKGKDYYENISNIVITGLGGSAICGDLLYCYLYTKSHLPIIVNRDYTLPAFVNYKTLLFVVSYSGNTEETISAYIEGLRKKTKIVIITSNGKLEELAKKDNTPYIIIPGGQPPRTALGFLFFPLLMLLDKIGLIKTNKYEIEEVCDVLEDLKAKYSFEVYSSKNYAKQLAYNLHHNLPLIYSSELFAAVAKRWKTQFNENSKSCAYYQVFPELTHNEIMAFESIKKINKNFFIIMLQDKEEFPPLQKTMGIFSSLVKDKVKEITTIKSSGVYFLSRLFSLIYLGDFVSIYLAFLNSIDPTPVKSIDLLKEKLKSGNFI